MGRQYFTKFHKSAAGGAVPAIDASSMLLRAWPWIASRRLSIFLQHRRAEQDLALPATDSRPLRAAPQLRCCSRAANDHRTAPVACVVCDARASRATPRAARDHRSCPCPPPDRPSRPPSAFHPVLDERVRLTRYSGSPTRDARSPPLDAWRRSSVCEARRASPRPDPPATTARTAFRERVPAVRHEAPRRGSRLRSVVRLTIRNAPASAGQSKVIQACGRMTV
jgi:hypothetical protein